MPQRQNWGAHIRAFLNLELLLYPATTRLFSPPGHVDEDALTLWLIGVFLPLVVGEDARVLLPVSDKDALFLFAIDGKDKLLLLADAGEDAPFSSS